MFYYLNYQNLLKVTIEEHLNFFFFLSYRLVFFWFGLWYCSTLNFVYCHQCDKIYLLIYPSFNTQI